MAHKAQAHLPTPALFAAAFLVAVGGLIYELILGTAASFLFGDSIVSFSLATGVTLFGMGIGSIISSRVAHRSSHAFAWNEVALGLIGGLSVLILFAAYSLTPYYWLVFILLSLAIGVLIGLEIPLMMRLFKARGSNSTINLLSRVLALDYFGALIASLLFPFLLLPHLGLLRTSLAVAVINISVALYLLYKIGVTVRASSFVIAVVSVLTLIFVYATQIEQAIDRAAYRDPVIYSAISPYQKIVLTQYKHDTRLYLNNQLQFSSIDEARYHETLAHSAMSSVRQPKKIAILGGGDGLLARELLKYPSVDSIDIIDLDPAMTNLARTNRLIARLNGNSLNDNRVTVINADAFKHIRESQQAYDVILADLVDPSNERIAKLYSKEFYRSALARLTQSGVFITQATSSFFTPKAFAMVERTVRSADETRTVVPLSINVPSFGEWGFVISLPRSSQPFTATKLPKNLKWLTDTKLAQAVQINGTQHTSVSTLLHPAIYTTYNADMAQWRY
ncbi:MAG: spermidine synthase [Patescibacteria group bacterium]|nr:spermidine synthase [Patescibacteria group bacterium]